jgi:hypothetical protein
MRKQTTIALTVAAMAMCGRLAASATTDMPRTLSGTSIDMLNTKMETSPEGLMNLRAMVQLEAQLRQILDREARRKTKMARAKVKDETKKIIEPLKAYITRLWPGRDVTKDLLRKSLAAHGYTAAAIEQSIIMQFLNQPDLPGMLAFFQNTIDDHVKFIQACREFVITAGDVRTSLSLKVRGRYQKSFSQVIK